MSFEAGFGNNLSDAQNLSSTDLTPDQRMHHITADIRGGLMRNQAMTPEIKRMVEEALVNEGYDRPRIQSFLNLID